MSHLVAAEFLAAERIGRLRSDAARARLVAQAARCCAATTTRLLRTVRRLTGRR